MTRRAAQTPPLPEPALATDSALTVPKAPKPSFVVGIGSSAGGLEALQDTLSQLAPGTSAAFVVAQHLAPEHRSLIVDLLTRVTDLQVKTAVNGDRLRSDVISVAPPHSDVTVDGDRIHVVESTARIGPSPSVDALFDSIAKHWGAKSIAVVLSGTGSDGANGLRLVRAASGFTMAQSPDSARFDGMPNAAISHGGVDLVADATEIGRRLSRLRSGYDGWDGTAIPEPEPMAVSNVTSQLFRSVGMDFSGYKDSTVSRQIQRRMAIRQVDTIEDYLPVLSADIEEAQTLARHLLVTVTSFFRNPASFEALTHALGEYIAKRNDTNQIRLWVPGCATGEEVYSLGMLIADLLGNPPNLDRHLKIFGTDLDESSLAVARRAAYPLSVLDRIPPGLRKQYVSESDQGFEIADSLRVCVVFARHSVGDDPPFPRLDFISCRNTMIYFTTQLQDRVLVLFRYALKPGGLLFLGASESLAQKGSGFEPIDAEHRIFARTHSNPDIATRQVMASRELLPAPNPPTNRVTVARHSANLEHAELLEALVRATGHPFLVIDDKHDLVEVVGDVTAYCQMPEGARTHAIAAYLVPELQAEARAIFLLSKASSEPVLSRVIDLKGEIGVVQMEARPLSVSGKLLTKLSFIQDDSNRTLVVPAVIRDQTFDVELVRLERELLATQEAMRRYSVELESANEELEAASEELQASSEELQASNEELEASNEELQATNEQLGTINEQLRQGSDQFQLINTDLENIQSSLSQGMIIVDAKLRITRYSPLAVRLFGILEADIGQSLLSVPSRIPLPGLDIALRKVLAEGTRQEFSTAANAGITYLIQILPYRNIESDQQGAIITMTDITEVTDLRVVAETAVAEFTRVVDALDEAVWKRTGDMSQVIFVSGKITEITGWTPSEIMADASLLDDRIDLEDRRRVVAARSQSDSWTVTYQLARRDGSSVSVTETARLLAVGPDRFMVGTLADTTNLHALENRAREAAEVLQPVFDNEAFGVALLDADDKVVRANATLCRLLGSTDRSIIGYSLKHFTALDTTENGPALEESVPTEMFQTPAGRVVRIQVSETERWVNVEVRTLSHSMGVAVKLIIMQDITALRIQSERLTYQATFDPVTGLLNRISFVNSLDREIARAQRDDSRLALAWVDIDNFKEVNDEHGHEVGDFVLHWVAERVLGAVRTSDLVGRLGGDEFGIAVVGYEHTRDLEEVLERILTAVRTPVEFNGLSISVTISLGVAISPADGATPDALFRAGDTAMYSVKRRGGDRYAFFSESMNVAAEARRRMRQDISAAIEKGQFELHYQPIVGSADNSLWGFESLLRWRIGEDLIPASEFVPFAEDSGQIRALGRLGLGLLHRDLIEIRSALPEGTRVTVNLSVTQLEDPQLVPLLDLDEAPAGLHGIVIEVVESILLPTSGRAMENLQLLADAGAEVAIDDYGTGYSNFTLLVTLAPNFIKLDRTLLPTSAKSERTSTLFKSAVELTHTLGGQVIAEGIEGSRQDAFARTAGADLLQGYFVAKPMPLAEALEWVANRA